MSAPASGPAHLHHHPRGSLQRAALRFGLLVALLAGAVVAVRFTPLRGYLTAENLQGWFGALRGAWWAPLVHVALCTVVGALGVPATPFLVLGAAIFGPYWGTLWNCLGIVLASIAGYGLARRLGREFVERVGGKKLERVERLLHRRGFFPLVAIRFVPVPFSLINAAAAVVGVRFSKFVAASTLGMVPPIAIITWFAARLLDAATGDRDAIVREMLVVSFIAAVIVFLPIAIRRRVRKRRLARLRARRAARPGSHPTTR